MIDPAQIQTALGLVAAATGATGGAVGVIQQIKGLIGSGQSGSNPELQALINDLSQRLAAANMLNVQLSETVKGLIGDIQREDEFKQNKSRYSLFKTNRGYMVWKLDEEKSDGQPEHFACPVCMEEGVIAFVQGETHVRRCIRCKRDYYFEERPLKNYMFV